MLWLSHNIDSHFSSLFLHAFTSCSWHIAWHLLKVKPHSIYCKSFNVMRIVIIYHIRTIYNAVHILFCETHSVSSQSREILNCSRYFPADAAHLTKCLLLTRYCFLAVPFAVVINTRERVRISSLSPSSPSHYTQPCFTPQFSCHFPLLSFKLPLNSHCCSADSRRTLSVHPVCPCLSVPGWLGF